MSLKHEFVKQIRILLSYFLSLTTNTLHVILFSSFLTLCCPRSILPNSASCGSCPHTSPEGRCVLSRRVFLPRQAASWSDTPSVLGGSRRTTAGSIRPSPGRRCTRGRRPGDTGGQHHSSAPVVPQDPRGSGVESPGDIQLEKKRQLKERKHTTWKNQELCLFGYDCTHHSHHQRSQ